jgi:hypothetical protein
MPHAPRWAIGTALARRELLFGYCIEQTHHRKEINRDTNGGGNQPRAYFPSRTRNAEFGVRDPAGHRYQWRLLQLDRPRLGLIRMFFASRHIPYRRMAP